MMKFAVLSMFAFLKHGVEHAHLCLGMLLQTFSNITCFITNLTRMKIFTIFLLAEIEFLKHADPHIWTSHFIDISEYYDFTTDYFKIDVDSLTVNCQYILNCLNIL